MEKIRVFIVGDSHTDAIKRALSVRRIPLETQIEFSAYRYSVTKNGKVIGDLSTEAIVDRISTFGVQDIVVSTIGGNQHQTLSLVQHPIPFELYELGESLPKVDAKPPTIVPRAQMLDFFEKGIRGGDGKRMQHLRANASCQILHLVPPPPKEDAAHIIKRFETKFAELGLLEKGVSPATLRLKMWRLQVEILRKLTAEFDIGLLFPPVNALTSEGFLDPVFYANDATHGNVAYGELVLQQLEALALKN